ncbi:MAG: hypothetical protein ACK55I_41665, partial [bacterium]
GCAAAVHWRDRSGHAADLSARTLGPDTLKGQPTALLKAPRRRMHDNTDTMNHRLNAGRSAPMAASAPSAPSAPLLASPAPARRWLGLALWCGLAILGSAAWAQPAVKAR